MSSNLPSTRRLLPTLRRSSITSILTLCSELSTLSDTLRGSPETNPGPNRNLENDNGNVRGVSQSVLRHLLLQIIPQLRRRLHIPRLFRQLPLGSPRDEVLHDRQSRAHSEGSGRTLPFSFLASGMVPAQSCVIAPMSSGLRIQLLCAPSSQLRGKQGAARTKTYPPIPLDGSGAWRCSSVGKMPGCSEIATSLSPYRRASSFAMKMLPSFDWP